MLIAVALIGALWIVGAVIVPDKGGPGVFGKEKTAVASVRSPPCLIGATTLEPDRFEWNHPTSSFPRKRESRSKRRAGPWTPAFALGDAHMFERPSFRDGMEVVEAVLECDRAWWSRRRVAVPSAQTSDDPGCPGQASAAVRIDLQRGFAFVLAIESRQRGHLAVGKDEAGGFGVPAVPGLGELKCDGGGLDGDCGKLEQPLGGVELTVLEPQALLFEDAEELLDVPARLVPIDDAPGASGIAEVMGRQKTPVQRFGIGGRMALDDLDKTERYACRQARRGALGAAHRDPAKTQCQLGPARRGGAARPQLDHGSPGVGQAFAHAIEAVAVGQAAILHDPGQQVEARARHAGPFFVKIALAVGNDRHRFGRGQHRLGALRRRDPAPRFLVGQRPLLVRRCDPSTPRPDLARHQAQATLIGSIERQHRVDENAAADPFANLAEPALPVLRRAEVDLARILDRQHMTPGHGGGGLLAPARNQIEAMEREVNNGGYAQFFVNSSKHFAPYIVQALQTIGCTEDAALAASAIAELRLPSTFDGEDCDKAYMTLMDEIDPRLEELASRYYETPEPLCDNLLLSYIEQQASAIRIPRVT